MITATLVYDWRKKANKDKKGSVDIRVTLNRKSYYISTGVKVYPKKWYDGFVINTVDSDELNERIHALLAVANKTINESIRNGVAVSIDEIKKNVKAATGADGGSRRDMIDWIAEQVDSLTLAPGTIKHYNTLVTRMNEYGGLMRWSDLTTENIYKFDAWLHKLPGVPGKSDHISDGGVWTYHKTLKALLNRAERFGKIDRNPYVRLNGQFKRGDNENTEFLTEHEVDAIVDMKLRKGSELYNARDLFVFQMFTGLSYGDTQVFDMSDYKKVDGRWINVGRRIKTGVSYVSELLPPVVDVLERHGWMVPHVSNQVYNRALKTLGEKAGIATPLHSHLARHTFATRMLAMGAKIENVSRMLGHTNIRQTQRYAKVLAESVYDDFEMVRKKMSEKKSKKKKGAPK